MTYSTTAIVLRTRAIREADRLYTVLTPDRGKLELLGQGTRKSASKLAGGLAVPGMLELHCARGKVVDRVAGVEVAERFSWSSLAQRTAGQAWFELVDRTTKHGKADRELFALVQRVAEDVGGIADVQTLHIMMDDAAWRLLDVLGFRPRLESCHECGRRDELVVFDARGGGALCEHCRPHIMDDRPLLPLPAETTRGLTTYLAEHLGIPWRGREVFEAVGR